MRSLSEVSSAEFSNGLTKAHLRVGMFIQAALGLGALFFFTAVLFVGFLRPTDIINTKSIDLLTTLTIADIILFIILINVGILIYRIFFSTKRLESAYNKDLHDRTGNIINATPVEKAITLIRAAMLIRTAFFELSAFWGLAILMVAATSGQLLSINWIWLNAIPLLAHLILIVFTFPTRNRIQCIFENNIQGHN